MTHDFTLTKSAGKSHKVPKNTKKKWLNSAKNANKVSKRRDSILLVLLSAHAKRVGVSRMQDFKNIFSKTTYIIL